MAHWDLLLWACAGTVQQRKLLPSWQLRELGGEGQHGPSEESKVEASGAVVLGAHWHSSQGQSSGEGLPLTSGRSSDSWKEKSLSS